MQQSFLVLDSLMSKKAVQEERGNSRTLSHQIPLVASSLTWIKYDPSMHIPLLKRSCLMRAFNCDHRSHVLSSCQNRRQGAANDSIFEEILHNLRYPFFHLSLVEDLQSNKSVIPCGLVVRIPAFHAGGPGSIPGVGAPIFFSRVCGTIAIPMMIFPVWEFEGFVVISPIIIFFSFQLSQIWVDAKPVNSRAEMAKPRGVVKEKRALLPRVALTQLSHCTKGAILNTGASEHVDSRVFHITSSSFVECQRFQDHGLGTISVTQ